MGFLSNDQGGPVFRRLIPIVVGLALLAATASAHPESSPSKGHPATSDGLPVTQHVHRFHILIRSAYDLERWQSGPKRSKIRKAQAHKQAIRIAKVRAQLAEFRDKRRRLFDQYRASQQEIAKLTPYPGPGGTHWAIPWSIVACESGGDFGARNSSSSAGGAYQVLDTTWLGYGGTDYADSHPAAVAPPSEQHLIASRIWAGGSGRGQWQC